MALRRRPREFFLVVEAEKLIIRTARRAPTTPMLAESAA
jgi:hypothetical protein